MPSILVYFLSCNLSEPFFLTVWWDHFIALSLRLFPSASSTALNEWVHFCLVPQKILGSWSLTSIWFSQSCSAPRKGLHTFCWKVASHKTPLQSTDSSEAFPLVPFSTLGEPRNGSSIWQVSKLSISTPSHKALSDWDHWAQMGNSKPDVPSGPHQISWEVEASGKCSLALCTYTGQSVLNMLIRGKSGSWRGSSKVRRVSRIMQSRQGVTVAACPPHWAPIQICAFTGFVLRAMYTGHGQRVSCSRHPTICNLQTGHGGGQRQWRRWPLWALPVPCRIGVAAKGSFRPDRGCSKEAELGSFPSWKWFPSFPLIQLEMRAESLFSGEHGAFHHCREFHVPFALICLAILPPSWHMWLSLWIGPDFFEGRDCGIFIPILWTIGIVPGMH